METENIFKIALSIALVIVLFVFLNSAMATGKPESYYMHMSPGLVPSYCVYADINWRTDSPIYCSEDATKTLMLTTALNAQIRNKLSEHISKSPSSLL
jgi:hypothetical protein